MRSLRRNAGRWAALGVVFTAIVMAAAPDGEVTASGARTRPAQVQGKAVSARTLHASQLQEGMLHVELERLAQPPEQETGIGGAFNATSWYEPPPPPPPAPPAPPPVPVAPPLPFAYLGHYEDAPTKVVILTKGERIYTVSEGDVIENTYRVEHVAPGTVELTYLPLNTRQALGADGTW